MKGRIKLPLTDWIRLTAFSIVVVVAVITYCYFCSVVVTKVISLIV